MRIIDVEDSRYHVVREIQTPDDDFISKIKDVYNGLYNDFVLLRAPENPAVKEHYLVCRKIDDAEIE